MCEKFIPLSVPNIKGNEIKYVTEALESEWVSTAGKYVNDFENYIAEYVNSKGAVSCQNGTSGLHIALLSCNVKRDDAVIVPALTFIAAVNPVRYIGAEPIFMDCDDSLCLDVDKVSFFCEEECDFIDNELIERESGRRVSAIVIVHIFGNMGKVDRLLEIAKKYRLHIIEDATEALGTYYETGEFERRFAGTIGDVGVYSFNGNKIITTGGGGMIVSNDESIIAKAKHLTTQAKSNELYYEHDEIGYNYRMTNIQAAMGIAQLEKLEEFIERKTRNYYVYESLISDIPGMHLLRFEKGIRANYWFYSLVCEDISKINRDDVIKKLAERRIQTRPIWGLICDQIPYKSCRSYKIDKARYYWEHIVNIPCSTNLEIEDIEYVMRNLRQIAE